MIPKRASVACRCNRKVCQSRRRLPKHPDAYAHPGWLRCRSCGKGRYRPDPHRTAGKERRKPCRCEGYSFPHARASLYCVHNPKLTAEMLRERHEAGAWA